MSKGKSRVRQFAPLAFARRQRALRNAGVVRSYHRRVPVAQELGHAADVVRMIVGQQNGSYACPATLQLIEHRGGIAGVDRDQPARVAWGADEPDIVVGDCLHGADS